MRQSQILIFYARSMTVLPPTMFYSCAAVALICVLRPELLHAQKDEKSDQKEAALIMKTRCQKNLKKSGKIVQQ